MILFSTTISGNLPSSKNRRRLITGRGGRRPLIIKSADALQYEKMFLSSIKPKDRIGYAGPVSVKVRVHYQSKRSDLSTEFIFDLLQKAGVIKNDNQIMHVESWKGLDRTSPRVHITVTTWEDTIAA